MRAADVSLQHLLEFELKSLDWRSFLNRFGVSLQHLLGFELKGLGFVDGFIAGIRFTPAFAGV